MTDLQEVTTKPVLSAPVQPGLRVRTALRAGAGNPFEGAVESVQSWWNSLFGGGAAEVAGTGTTPTA